MESLLQLCGRLHPLAVHLPIGIFVLLALVEGIGFVRPSARLTPAQRTVFLGFGLVFAILAAALGWQLARHGEYDIGLLDRHRWLGTGFAAMSIGLFFLRRHRRLYAIGLLLSLPLLLAAGHQGGSLTHGEDYLAVFKANSPRPIYHAPGDARIFDDVIHPILQARCVSCHGPTKSNGDLRYDTREFVAQGGKSGPTLKPGSPPTSPLLKRIHLPLEAKEHMPPKGKPQLTDEEMSLLVWWIDVGAPVAGRVADFAPTLDVADLVAARVGIPAAPLPDRPTMLREALRLEQQLGLALRPLSQDGPWLAANARLRRTAFGDADLAALAPVAEALTWLDLGETAVTDAGMATLTRMKNLRRLQLDHTAITGQGLAHLKGLPKLESLNLVGLKLADPDVTAIAKLPRLRTLYLWNTAITDAALAELTRTRSDPRKMNRWRNEISDLEAKIRSETFTVVRGAPPTPPHLSTSAPLAPPASKTSDRPAP